MSVNIQTSSGLVKIAGTPTIDTDLSNVSKNPVQNKVVTEKINEINSNLTSEISRAKETEEVLKSRIDTIASLPEGSTTGDAELQDIRVKADGTTATSAGNAVREQVSKLKSDLIELSDDVYIKSNVKESTPLIYKGKAKVENVVGEVYTGTLNIFQLMNTIDFDVNVYGLHIIKNGTNIKISGTSTSNGAFSFSKGAALSTSEMRNQGGGYALPNDYSYIFKLFVEKENFQGLRPSFSIINNSSGTIADVNTSNIESPTIAYNESWGQIYWWIPSDCTFDCEYEFGLFVSDFNSLYRTEKTSKVTRIIADGTYEIGELTLGNCDIYKMEVRSEKNRNDCLPLDYGSEIAWFGDSISQLQHLPHRVGENIGATVYDCSFAGSTLAYDSPRDTGITILALSSMIVSGDFSALDTTLNQQEADGRDVTEKRINASTLKSIDFNDIDSIVVMSGTNEMNNDYTYDDGLVKFKNAMDTAIKNIVTTYPHIRMYFISNPYRGDYTPEKPDKFGMSLVDYIEAEKEVCYANNIPFYDLYHSSGINASTVSYYMNSDLLHQNENGDILLAEKCAKWLMSN